MEAVVQVLLPEIIRNPWKMMENDGTSMNNDGK